MNVIQTLYGKFKKAAFSLQYVATIASGLTVQITTESTSPVFSKTLTGSRLDVVRIG